MKEKRIFKEFGVNEASTSGDTLTVVASVMGDVDLCGDVILPGAFTKAVTAKFDAEGWVDAGHEWELPIGYPVETKVVGNELVSTAKFHSHDEAQGWLTVVQERLSAGKKVSVSVSFMPDWEKRQEFNDGASAIAWAKGAGVVEGLDLEAIRAYQGPICVWTEIKELFEWSLVVKGMHPKARAVALKGYTKDDLEDGSRLELTVLEHLDLALAATAGVTTRLKGIAEKRAETGRELGDETREKAQNLLSSLTELLSTAKSDPENGNAFAYLDLRMKTARSKAKCP